MTGVRILALDQGTSSTKAVLVDSRGGIAARFSAPLATAYPRPGWAEQDAGDIWASARAAIAGIVAQAGTEGIAGIGIANQRETLVVWDAATGTPVTPAILWQCRRTADACAALHAAGRNAQVEGATGLGINPLFPASKLGWVMDHVAAARGLADAGRLRAGTVDAWLLWNLTGGAVFATDHSNASRTQLFNTGTLEWDAGLGVLFGAPLTALPRPLPSDSRFGETVAGATALPAGVPVLAMLGDSHAALYGHGIRTPGTVKATFGTGSSLMALTPARTLSRNGLSATIAWSTAQGVAHAMEGNITVSAQAAGFVADLLGLADAQSLSDLAQTVGTSDGVTFVPALAGLGAPHWNDRARGCIDGMTLGTRPAHLARATFEAIALQVADVLAAMERDIGQPLTGLRADGGASGNAFLMQLQADVLDRPVLCRDVAEVGALGVAAMAFGGLGVDPAQVLAASGGGVTFTPSGHPQAALLAQWDAAIARALRA